MVPKSLWETLMISFNFIILIAILDHIQWFFLMQLIANDVILSIKQAYFFIHKLRILYSHRHEIPIYVNIFKNATVAKL